jgi:nitroreductase
LIERLLSAAAQAPNHYKVRPWRFIVLQGEALRRLGDVFADILQSQHTDLPESALDKERTKPLRAPLVIAVGVDLPQDPRVIEIENVCAAAAAVQNLLLAAEALGLATKWRTGSQAFEPRVKQFLGLHPQQPLIGFIYIGYPQDAQGTPDERPSFEDRTVWLD